MSGHHPAKGFTRAIWRISRAPGEFDLASAVMVTNEEAPGTRGEGDSLHRDDGRVLPPGAGIVGTNVDAKYVGIQRDTSTAKECAMDAREC